MNNKLWSIVFVTFLVLCGCSGFTTDGDVACGSNEANALTQAYNSARTYMTGTYEVTGSVGDSRSGSIVISLNQEDGSVQQESYSYSFGKDTLYLTSTQTDAAESATVLAFVGGTAGKLQGIWRLVSSDNAIYYWKFENKTIEIRVAETNSAAAASEEVVSELDGEFYAAHDFARFHIVSLGKSADGISDAYGMGVWSTEKCGGLGTETCGSCKKEGDGYKWYSPGESGDRILDTLMFHFRGDTLMMSKVENKYRAFVGGSQGNIEGIWKQTNVGYIGDSLIDLSSDTFELLYMKVEKDSITYAFDMNPDYDYMETELIYNIKNHLVDGSSRMNFYGAFDASDDELEDGISLLGHSNTRDVVSINGKLYEITLNYAYWLWTDVSVTVKSGDMTCSGRYVQFEQTTQEMCRAENAENLDSYDEGETFYVIDEQASFEQCLDQMRTAQ